MKIKKVLFSMIMAFMPFSNIHMSAASQPVYLQTGYVDPINDQGGSGGSEYKDLQS